MSIIYDALKKVEGSGGRQEKQDDLKNKPRPALKIYLLYVLVICFGLFTANQLFSYLTRSQNLTTNVKNTSAQNILKSAKHNELSKEKLKQPAITASADNNETDEETNKTSFVLNGVFYSGNTGFALINNRILKEGDKISGATVKRIGLDSVDLENNGKVSRLSTHLR